MRKILLTVMIGTLAASCTFRSDLIPRFETYALEGSRIVATGSSDGSQLDVLVTRTNGERGSLAPLKEFDGPGALSVSDSGNLLLTEAQAPGDTDSVEVALIDLQTGRDEVLRNGPECARVVCKFDFSANSGLLALAGEHEIEVRRTNDPAAVPWFSVKLASEESFLGIGNDGALITCLCGSGVLRVRPYKATAQELRIPSLAAVTAQNTDLVVLNDGRLLLLVGRSVLIIDTRTGRIREAMTLPTDPSSLPPFPYFAGMSANRALIGYKDGSGASAFVQVDVARLKLHRLGTVNTSWLYHLYVSSPQVAAGISINGLRRAASRTLD